MDNQPIAVSVIIPAYTIDRMEDIYIAISSVRSQSYQPIEIIVAVDHNTELRDLLLKESIRVAFNDKVVGGAETRNAGIKAACGDVVAFLDDDAWADKDWLWYIMRRYEDPDVYAVGGKTISTWETGRPVWFPGELDWLVGGIWEGHREDYGEVRNLIGPNMSFRREVCDTIGYMRTELGAMPGRARAGDETEFYIRLKSMIPTGKVMYEPSAVVYHKVYAWKSTISHLIRRSASDGYWKSRTAKVFNSLVDKAFHVETSYLRFLLFDAVPSRVARFWVKGNVAQAAAILLSILCVGSGYVWGKVR